ncbi:MAG: hypothetical protein LBB67_00985 [Oscillospiraceae bacterium]|jgi:hypothetical protein|nr:hypothetical protein [Oscillospiraceae bacterium]
MPLTEKPKAEDVITEKSHQVTKSIIRHASSKINWEKLKGAARNVQATYTKASQIAPILGLVIFCWFFAKPIQIPILHLYISYGAVLGFFVPTTLLWIALKPYKTICNSKPRKVAAQFLPFEIYFTLQFARFHFLIALLSFVLSIALPCVLFTLFLRSDIGQKKQPRKILVRIFLRFAIPAAAVILLAASLGGLFTIGKPLLAPQTTAKTVGTAESQKLLHALDAERWVRLTDQQRIDFLQILLSEECAKLGVDTVPLEVEVLSKVIKGKTKEHAKSVIISYDIVHSTANNARDICLRAILHEARHVLQWSVVDNINWDEPENTSNAYYAQAHAWHENFENYNSNIRTADYTNQPVEADAKNYAEQRINEYIKAIEDYNSGLAVE